VAGFVAGVVEVVVEEGALDEAAVVLACDCCGYPCVEQDGRNYSVVQKYRYGNNGFFLYCNYY